MIVVRTISSRKIVIMGLKLHLYHCRQFLCNKYFEAEYNLFAETSIDCMAWDKMVLNFSLFSRVSLLICAL